MSEIYYITTEVRTPSGRPGDYGQIAEGYYVIEDGVLTMTDSAGRPVRRLNGDPVKRTLQPGDDPKAIARNFTRDLRLHFHGDSADFNRRLIYPPSGVV